MSKYYIDTENIEYISRKLQNYSGKLGEARGLPFTIQTQLQMYLQFGYNLSDIKNRLREVSNDITELYKDLACLSQGLRFVTDESIASENRVWSSFTNIPVNVLTNKPITRHNYTYEFISTRDSFWDKTKDVLLISLDNFSLTNAHDIDEEMVESTLKQFIGGVLSDSYNSTNKFLDYSTDVLDDDVWNLVTDAVAQGEDIGKVLKNIKCDNKIFKDFVDALTERGIVKDLSNNLGEASFATGEIIEMVQMLYTNYSENIKILSAIKNAMADAGYHNDTIAKVIDEMLKDYVDQYWAAVKNFSINCFEYSLEEAMGILTGGIYDVTLFARDLLFSVTGMGENADCLEYIYVSQWYSSALEEKYQFYAYKINSGNYTPHDLEQCNLYYELATEAKLQE